ncbi:hypothetical protein RCL1_003500 [Eukaryota sp. TZLM3-RCL]
MAITVEKVDTESEHTVALPSLNIVDDVVKPLKDWSLIEGVVSFLCVLFFPLRKSALQVEKHMGSTVGFFLHLSRVVFGSLFCLCLISVPFTIQHFQHLSTTSSNTFLNPSFDFYPNFYVPSSFSTSLAPRLSLTIVSALFVLILFAGLFVLFSARLKYRYESVRDGNTVNSPHFLGLLYSFDWSKNSVEQIAHQQSAFLENVQIEIAEEHARIEKLKIRKNLVPKFVLVKRYIGFTVLTIYSLASAAIIYYLGFSADKFKENVESLEWHKFIQAAVTLSASFAVSISNVLGPIVYSICAKLIDEKSPSVKISHQLMGLFLFRIIALIALMIEVQISVDADNVDFCVLNVVTSRLTTVMITTFILDKVIDFALVLAKLLFLRLFKRYSDMSDLEKFSKRDEFPFALQTNRVLFHLALTLLVFPFSPLTSFASLLFAYLTFKWDCWFIETFQKAPKDYYRKEHSRFNFSFLFSYLILLAIITLVSFSVAKHKCGAFAETSPLSVSVLMNPMLLVPLCLLAFVWFKARVYYAYAYCYHNQLLMRKRAANASILKLRDMIRFKDE